MNEPNIRTILNHPNRFRFTMGISVIIGLLAVWPAVDALSQTQGRLRETRQEIEDVRSDTAQIEPLRRRLDQLQQRITEGFKTIDETTAQQLRDKCVQAMFRHKVTAVQVKLNDPTERPWTKDKPPFGMFEVDLDEAEFTLTERKLSLLVEGRQKGLDRLIEELETLHPFARITRLTMRDNARTGTVTLDAEIRIYDLKENRSK